MASTDGKSCVFCDLPNGRKAELVYQDERCALPLLGRPLAAVPDGEHTWR